MQLNIGKRGWKKPWIRPEQLLSSREADFCHLRNDPRSWTEFNQIRCGTMDQTASIAICGWEIQPARLEGLSAVPLVARNLVPSEPNSGLSWSSPESRACAVAREAEGGKHSHSLCRAAGVTRMSHQSPAKSSPMFQRSGLPCCSNMTANWSDFLCLSRSQPFTIVPQKRT
jgi:hypothetical protein